jgi:ABC-2 type transport system permease protein
MSLKRTLAITARLLTGFRHDHRTLGILFVTPILLLGLFAILFRTDAPVPRVGVVAADGLGAVIAAQLAESDAVETVEVASATDAERQVRDGELDAYVGIPSAADASGVLRLEVVVEGTDTGVRGIVPAALQRAVIAGIAAYAPPVPSGAPPMAVPELDVEVRSLFGGDDLDALDLFGGPFIGLLVFFLVYIVTSISFLRERAEGTLERLMASPLGRGEIVLGYMLGFMAVALVQAAEVLGFGLIVIGLYNVGSVWLLLLIVIVLALTAVNLGIFLSTFARNEFQAVQFIPLVLVPQILLSGLLVPIASEPGWLQVVSNVLPLTYAVDALRDVMLRGAGLASASVELDLAVLVGFCVVVIAAASLTLRREVA